MLNFDYVAQQCNSISSDVRPYNGRSLFVDAAITFPPVNGGILFVEGDYNYLSSTADCVINGREYKVLLKLASNGYYIVTIVFTNELTQESSHEEQYYRTLDDALVHIWNCYTSDSNQFGRFILTSDDVVVTLATAAILGAKNVISHLN